LIRCISSRAKSCCTHWKCNPFSFKIHFPSRCTVRSTSTYTRGALIRGTLFSRFSSIICIIRSSSLTQCYSFDALRDFLFVSRVGSTPLLCVLMSDDSEIVPRTYAPQREHFMDRRGYIRTACSILIISCFDKKRIRILFDSALFNIGNRSMCGQEYLLTEW